MPPKTSAVYYAHLAQDALLKPLLDTVEPYELSKKTNVCLHLCSSIMSQQLSVKVADVIFKRFLALYDGNEPTPQQVVDTPHETLRAIGLSNAKVRYVQNVAGHMIAHNATDDMLHQMSDEAVTEFVTRIKGVGRWTAEMLLMFTLAREDVFATDDLGIQQTMAKIYNLDMTNKKELRQRMLDISAAWAPYRTYACFYLWKYKDAK